jgi:hypothetical protein
MDVSAEDQFTRSKTTCDAIEPVMSMGLLGGLAQIIWAGVEKARARPGRPMTPARLRTTERATKDHGRVARVIKLDDDTREAINGAFAARNFVVLGYVGDDGAPRLSFRGSTQVFGPDQLAIWVRNPEGGLMRAVRNRPRVSLLYRSSEPRRVLTFVGHAHVDPSANDVVYSNAHPAERDRDPEKKGVALIVDLDEVSGFGPSGPIRMTRD